ncbi:hypothetical protein Tco_0240804 [Tanacetum coccineum]
MFNNLADRDQTKMDILRIPIMDEVSNPGENQAPKRKLEWFKDIWFVEIATNKRIKDEGDHMFKGTLSARFDALYNMMSCNKSLDLSVSNYPAYSSVSCLQGLLVVGDRMGSSESIAATH